MADRARQDGEDTGRWWVASAWLWLMLFFNLACAILLAAALTGLVHVTRTSVPLQIYGFAGSIIQVGCVAAILKGRRWGWWGLLLVALITCLLNLVLRHPIAFAMAGLAGPAITFLVLKGGGRRAAWPRLR